MTDHKLVSKADLNNQVETYIKDLKDKGTDDLVIQKEANTLRETLGLKELPLKLSLTQKIRDWIETVEGEFYTRNIFEELNIANTEKGKVSVVLTRLIEEKLIERSGKRTGQFRKPDRETEIMTLFGKKPIPVDIILPFDLHKICQVFKNSIIIIAGEPNQGKTGICLNIVADNMDRWEIDYFSSEMEEEELTDRLMQFDDIPATDWRFTSHKRSENFHDVIISGEGHINIIDYLELYEDFWIVAKRIAEIWRKLDGALAIIALQKNPEVAVPLGGYRGLEKARLAISLEKGKLKILKAKKWTSQRDPNNTIIKFHIAKGGCKFIEDY